jgi:pyridoxal phosphate-dependent aminotransferase EpsN
VKAGLALNSGTGAIHLAMDLLDVGPGNHFLVQSFTFCGTVNAVIYCGAQAVFIDLERDTWNMDPDALQSAIHDIEDQGKP